MRDAMTTPATEPMDFAAYLDAWLSHARGRVRAKTWQGYEGMIRLYVRPTLGEIPLDELGPLDLQHLYGDLLARPLSGGTVLNTHLVLTQALGQAVRWGYLQANPAAGAQPPRPRRAEGATVDQAATEAMLAAAVGTRFEVPAAIAIATGMRRGEILGLKWKDITPDFSTAQVRRSLQHTKDGLVFEAPKTSRSRRSVILPTFLHSFICTQRDLQQLHREKGPWSENDLVIDNGKGAPWNPQNFSPAWSTFLRKAGLPHVRFHDLRHAHATLMLQQGVHPKIVSERLGHASIGITLDTYSHVLPTMQQDAADAFDALFGPKDVA